MFDTFGECFHIFVLNFFLVCTVIIRDGKCILLLQCQNRICFGQNLRCYITMGVRFLQQCLKRFISCEKKKTQRGVICKIDYVWRLFCSILWQSFQKRLILIEYSLKGCFADYSQVDTQGDYIFQRRCTLQPVHSFVSI